MSDMQRIENDGPGEIRLMGNEPKRLGEFVQRAAPTMKQLAQGQLTDEKIQRLSGLAQIAMHNNDALAKCSTQSFFFAFLDAARTGLEWDGVDGALVPFWNKKAGVFEAKFMPMYRGLIRLLVESGVVLDVEAVPVYAGEEYRIERGTDPKIHHVVELGVDRSEDSLIGAYSVFWLRSGARKFHPMSKQELDRIRSFSKTADWGPWKDHFVAMALKTTIRLGCKTIPVSLKAKEAMEIDNRAETGGVSYSASVMPQGAQIPKVVDATEQAPALPRDATGGVVEDDELLADLEHQAKGAEAAEKQRKEDEKAAKAQSGSATKKKGPAKKKATAPEREVDPEPQQTEQEVTKSMRQAAALIRAMEDDKTIEDLDAHLDLLDAKRLDTADHNAVEAFHWASSRAIAGEDISDMPDGTRDDLNHAEALKSIE